MIEFSLFQLVHKIIDKLLGRRGPLYQDYSNVWSLDEWWKVNDWFRDICRACVRQNMNKEEVCSLTILLIIQSIK